MQRRILRFEGGKHCISNRARGTEICKRNCEAEQDVSEPTFRRQCTPDHAEQQRDEQR